MISIGFNLVSDYFMVFQALSDLCFGSVYSANTNIRRNLAKHGTTHLQ